MKKYFVLLISISLWNCENPLTDRVDALESEQEAQQITIDSLMAEITTHQTEVDSVLEFLASSALDAGFEETEVYSGSINTSWTYLDLSSIVGNKTSLVLIKFNGYGSIGFRPGDSTDEWVSGGSSSENGVSVINSNDKNSLGLISTDNNGYIQFKAYETISQASLSLIFYLN